MDNKDIKTKKEIRGFRLFLHNRKEKIITNEIQHEPYGEASKCDILYLDEEYQVTYTPHDISKINGILSKDDNDIKIEEAKEVDHPNWLLEYGCDGEKECWKKYILDPLEKKKDGEKHLTLLICVERGVTIPPFDKEFFDKQIKKLNRTFKKTKYKEIYLVDDDENIRLY